ncbi:anhydro-N-acetylmuramic acid kinase [Spongiivirga citrea]|uniref:Anhydro-N-acetylmuramic acid kinase n=1 Tax=Spongiivirga citrea TaxID=1481457 RepID=A0A6M0CD02_9FLAO|nr:anhydro-N-acetylmuramic acid kinase [Spongiivirga citrea]NER15665.1 anhydro-N-acetylmuramic acid kinase [Spongiivirga citrea]
MKTYSAIGLMSGTSLDGLDIVHCTLTENKSKWNYVIHHTKSISYDDSRRKQLKNAINFSATDLLKLHHKYGKWLGEQVDVFAKENKIKPDYVASHGHTIHHQPHNKFTFQIGYGQDLASACGIRTISDFRSADIAANGQGAPLVPIGDELFFGEYDFCLNLGGISNVSYKKDGKRLAYDIGIANMILNYIIQKTGKQYDDNGSVASSGVINRQLLDSLNNLDYYKQSKPKSTGYEWFLSDVIPILNRSNDSTANLLCTAVHHITQTVSHDIKELSNKPDNTILITGGGAFNGFLMQILSENLGNSFQIEISNKQLIEFKEALVFALMGALRLENQPNCLASVTGAKANVSGGIIFNPN